MNSKKKLERRINTYTTTFLMPMIINIFPNRSKLGFINAYIGDHGHTRQYKEALYVLCSPRFTSDYMKFESILEDHPMHLATYDVKRGYVMHVISVPPKYLEDYFNFLVGEYSKFTPEYKSLFKKGTNAHMVVNKAPYLKKYWEKRLEMELPADKELYSIWKPEREIYRFDADIYHKEQNDQEEKERA
jgi:hypothetical protein